MQNVDVSVDNRVMYTINSFIPFQKYCYRDRDRYMCGTFYTHTHARTHTHTHKLRKDIDFQKTRMWYL